VAGDRWRCPRCDREFARANQSHTCVPGITLAEYLRRRTPQQRDVFEALMAYLRSLGPLHVDAVEVGVFLKRQQKLAELRPRRDGVMIYLVLPYAIDAPRCQRSERIGAGRIGNLIRVTAAAQVDAELQEWLRQAYAAAG